MAFKGKHKIWDNWEKTIYQVEGQPYVGLLVFRIKLVAREGMVIIAHQNLLLLFRSNIKEDSEKEESQQGVERPPDCILAVSDDEVLESKVVLTDPELKGEGYSVGKVWTNWI